MLPGIRIPPPPPGFRTLREGRAIGWVREEAGDWILDALRAHGTLYAAARAESDGGAPFHGRAPVFLLRRGSIEYVVRRFTRGGAMNPLLGDRFLLARFPRPFAELRVSEAIRRAGIPTPRVLAANVFPSGIFYRGEIVTARVTEAADLGDLLFESAEADPSGNAALRLLSEAGGFARRLAAAGIFHPDLNVKNLLARDSAVDRRLYLLDLDRCRIRDHPDARDAARMSRRLLRSIRRWEGRFRRSLPPEAIEALSRGAGEPSR